jgi:hypothetical protein
MTTTSTTDNDSAAQALQTIEMTMVENNLSQAQKQTQQLQQQFKDALDGTDTDTDN